MSVEIKISGISSEKQTIKVAALYRFFHVLDLSALQSQLLADALELGIKGTLLVAKEGINGTIAAPEAAMDVFLDRLRKTTGLLDLTPQLSFAKTTPFYRMKVKLKQEIVTLGHPGIDPLVCVGTYVDPENWNELITRPDVLLIDTRNEYECAIGQFRGAVNPHTTSFRDFPQFVEDHLDLTIHSKVAMYCTGGIRCEKSTAFLKQSGVEHVYHLKGGILAYLASIPLAESLWEGECFVFDNRVSVTHGLHQGSYDLCHACRYPITSADKASNEYQPGVSCPQCYHHTTSEDKQRFAQRQQQIHLAKLRGHAHLGEDQKLLSQKLLSLRVSGSCA